MKTPLSLLPAILCLAAAPAALAQTFKLDKAAYEAGQSITATWTGGPGNSTDWVGIYREGETPGSTNVYATLWFYGNGTRNATEGVTDGSVTFPNIQLAAGNWVAHFLANDGYDPITEPVPFIIEGVILNDFTSDVPVIKAGDTATLNWFIDLNGQPAPQATITGGSAPADVTNMETLEVSPAVTTTYTLSVGTAPARTVTVYVLTENSAEFSLDSVSFPSSRPLTATWSGGPGNGKDWIGIYKIGDRPGPVGATLWWYVNGARTSTEGLAAGSVVFPPDLAPGEYFAAFFLNDGYTMINGPVGFMVTAAPFEIRDVQRLDTGEIELSWFSDPNAPVTYDVKESTDLSTWTTVEAASFLPPATGAGFTSATFFPGDAVGGRLFYKVVRTE